MTAELKQIVVNRIDALAEELLSVSHDIHAHREDSLSKNTMRAACCATRSHPPGSP